MTVGFPANRSEEYTFPLMSFRENGGAVAPRETDGEVSRDSFFGPAPPCQLRYRINTAANTTIMTRTSGNAPIPFRERKIRLIQPLPLRATCRFDAPIRRNDAWTGKTVYC